MIDRFYRSYFTPFRDGTDIFQSHPLFPKRGICTDCILLRKIQSVNYYFFITQREDYIISLDPPPAPLTLSLRPYRVSYNTIILYYTIFNNHNI